MNSKPANSIEMIGDSAAKPPFCDSNPQLSTFPPSPPATARPRRNKVKAGSPQPASLSLVFALADFFKHGEPGLFRVGDGKRLELVRRIEGGNDFVHRLFARRTMRQRLGRKRPAQREFPAAHLAVAFAQLVFVKRHEMNFDSRL